MIRSLIALLAIPLLVVVAAAAPNDFGGAPAAGAPPQDEVLLGDGTLLTGRILEELADRIVFETDALGRLEIPRTSIVRLARGVERTGALSDPDYNSLMFCPTPATLARGDSYFRDFELFFLNYGAAVSDALNLSVGTLFPVSSEVLMVSLGGKLRLTDRETQPVGLALTGSYTRLEEVRFGAVGVVAGVGDRRRSLNLAVNQAFDDDGDTELAFILGADVQSSRRGKVFAEYMSSASLLADEDADLEGFLNLGLRLFGESHSFSLSGFRPLTDDSSSFIAFPMLMYSNHW
ncbi:MAG: hypothetical protein IPI34_09420 [bacterium]|nr:hypothetical protein [bacterium]